MKTEFKYGSPEYYCEMFSDILADVEGEDMSTADDIVKGFYLAIDSWLKYHQEQAFAYGVLRSNVKQALGDPQNT